MSYLYDVMKKALGGTNFKSGTVSKDWSPNEVRAIVLMRDFLLVADYLKYPSVTIFNQEELYIDLMNPNRRGNLNNLLSERQLSCLEEIYVDEAFRSNFQGVINLEAYVQEMFNSRSRLRYWGFVSGMQASVVEKFYQGVIQQSLMDATLAKNMGGFRYQDAGNDDWYKKYNLRDQFYDLDKPKGRLHIYFAKCQKVIGDEQAEAEGKVKELEETKKLVPMVNFDQNVANRVYSLLAYSKFLKEMETPLLRRLGEDIGAELKRSIVCKGLTPDKVQNAIKCIRVNSTRLLENLYKNVGVYDTEDREVEQKEDGVYGLGRRLSDALLKALKGTTSYEDRVIWRVMAMSCSTLPSSEFTNELSSSLRVSIKTGDMNYETLNGLIRFAYTLGGISEECFNEKIRGGVN